MEKKYTINDIIDMMLGKYYIILISTVLCGVVFFVYSKFVIPEKYESYASMYVKNSSEVSENNNVNLSDLNASKSLVETYIEVLNSNSVMSKVAEDLTGKFDKSVLAETFSLKNGKLTAGTVRKCFSMSASNQTEVLKISAKTTNPEVSAEMCNLIAAIAPEFLIRIVGAGSVEVIDQATPSLNPVEPNVPRLTIAGLALGFFLSCGFIYLLDLLDNRINDKDLLADMYHKPILGSIQHVSVGGKDNKQAEKGSSLQLISDNSVPFNYIESYKSIRTNVLFSMGAIDGKILAVSSPSPDDGKSTVAANLAMALAQNGEKVLLIDGDMRKPVIHKMFKQSNKVGLSTTIISLSTFSEAVKKDVALNLDLLPAGPTPPNPSELLASGHFRKLIHELENLYDYIVIDTPPITVVSDAVVCSDIISGFLLVLRHRKTTYSEVSDAMNNVKLANANLIGFIINDIRHNNRGAYYYRYKDSYYAYKEYK